MYDLGEFLVDLDLVEFPVYLFGLLAFSGLTTDGMDSRVELCTQDYELLERSNVQWLCCKCESINVSTFTFRSYELELSNIYEPISV
jgi:hypothetical protein